MFTLFELQKKNWIENRDTICWVFEDAESNFIITSPLTLKLWQLGRTTIKLSSHAIYVYQFLGFQGCWIHFRYYFHPQIKTVTHGGGEGGWKITLSRNATGISNSRFTWSLDLIPILLSSSPQNCGTWRRERGLDKKLVEKCKMCKSNGTKFIPGDEILASKGGHINK